MGICFFLVGNFYVGRMTVEVAEHVISYEWYCFVLKKMVLKCIDFKYALL